MPNDTRLQQAVLSELNWDPSVDSAHIGVTAKRGVVALMRRIATYGQKQAAEAAARRVKGVAAVSIPRDAVQVRVEKGWATLTGQADWYYQKSAVEQEIRRLFGAGPRCPA